MKLPIVLLRALRDPRLRMLPLAGLAAALGVTLAFPLISEGHVFNDYRTLLVSRASGGSGHGGNRASTQPSISLDASYIGFASSATNLGGRGHRTEVFVRAVAADRTSLVSRADGPRGAPANGDSEEPALSGSGRIIAFSSRATNLGGRRGVE
ncbi:MAG: hypothetical protein ACRDNS_03730, partial [Trebonia sp.]